MSSPEPAKQRARKESDRRALQRATIAIGVVSLGLTGALVYAAASDTIIGKGSAPAPDSNPIVSADPTPIYNGETDDEHGTPRPPAGGLQSPRPGTAPVAVTGGS